MPVSFISLLPMVSLGLTLLGLIFSILFKVTGKLRLTIPLVYTLLMCTVFSDWSTENEDLAIYILIGLVVLCIGSWFVSLYRFFTERRRYKYIEDDMAYQLRKARQMGADESRGFGFDERQELIYSDTGERVFK